MRLPQHLRPRPLAERRRSLLALHAACREVHGRFAYLEIGSHLGGSLQAFVCDEACEAIVSIDPRPSSQPDGRGIVYRYDGNSTARMLENLKRLPGADLGKLRTIDAGTDSVDPAELGLRPTLCFVDGEHTDAAVLRDAGFCRAALDDDPAGPRGQALAARYIELGRQMADTTDEKLADHVTAKPASFDPDSLLEELSDEQRAKIKRALAPFSDPRERDFIRRALAARSETR